MANLKSIICVFLGAIGGTIANLFGGWTEDMATLIIFMAIDFLMGLIVAGVFHKSGKTESGSLNSFAGWKGLCKKGISLLFVLIAHRLDLLLEIDYIKTTVIIGFIASEGLSIIENAGLMGIPFPSIITKSIELLKNKSDNEQV
jgi:toxin secretion/phage lysis holin